MTSCRQTASTTQVPTPVKYYSSTNTSQVLLKANSTLPQHTISVSNILVV